VEPPTEFQRLVESSVGRTLPIFGASLFEKVPSTFAPLDWVPVSADYVLGPGDELLVRVWGQQDLSLDLTVDRAGDIYIPRVGNVRIAGVQFQQIRAAIRSQLERIYRNFDLSVNLGQLRSIQIFVVGQARRPGTYMVSSLSTLVNALFASGGPSAQGSMRRIQLKRGAGVVGELDLYELLLQGDKSKDVPLLPGDVIYIPMAGPAVALAGSVKNAAIFELKTETSLSEALQLAGGLAPTADGRRILVERINDHGSREVLEASVRDARSSLALRDGDLIRVLTVAPRFENAITLRGNVSNPGRFAWRAGMRLRDVIPDRESLITRDYWRKRNFLGFTPPAEAVPQGPVSEENRTDVAASAPAINWSYAVVERQDPKDLSAQLLPFHLGKLVLERDDSQNLELQPGDVVTVFSQADVHVSLMQQNRQVRMEGEFNAAGIYVVRPGETLGQLIQRAGGLTPQAYLFGSEFVRESTRLDQQRRLDEFVSDLDRDLEEASANQVGTSTSAEESAAMTAKLEGDRRLVEKIRSVRATGRIVLNLEPNDRDVAKLMDLQLEDGDRFLVPSRPSMVNVLGAVYNQNAFLHEAGLRITDYLREAGGATRNADKGKSFVIRADGSVIPAQGFSPFTKSFGAERLNPGDSIVVPVALFKSSFLRGLRDWTQVFAQLALGAAAINVLK
jgi:protein involved in polysaccharide export with SLBB domain